MSDNDVEMPDAQPPSQDDVPTPAVLSADDEDASAPSGKPAPSPPSSPTSHTSASLASQSLTTVDTDKPANNGTVPSPTGLAPPTTTNGRNSKPASSQSRSPAPDFTPNNDNIPNNDNAAASAEPSTVPSASASKPASTAAERKPKSTKARKSRSPSPLPPPPPPLQTVRLQITLGGPENYEVDITDLAKQTGQRNPTPPPVKRDTSDSEDDSEREGNKPAAAAPEKGKGKHKKRNADYDLNDPFIDDSELAIDDRTHFAQTKQQGFYVSSGEVALLKDKTPKKHRPKHPLLMNASASAPVSTSHAHHPALQSTAHPAAPSTPTRPSMPLEGTLEGTRESPIALLDDDESKPSTSVLLGLKRSASSASSSTAPATGVSSSLAVEPSKKKRRTDLQQPLHPDLERSIDELKIDIAKESFEVKGKFPPALKPLLTKLAIQAILLGEYNETFFSRMPQIFPYNRFTMMKLIKRLVYTDHQKLLQDRQDELLEKLKELADKGFDQAKAEWERNVQHWKLSANGDDNGESPAPNEPKDSSKTLNRKLEELQEKEPPKKYRLTEEMKKIFWELYCLSNECSRLTNEKNQLEGIGEQVSEQGMRKGLYQKIIGVFPEGWMTSGNISRDISVIKKKMETDPSRYEDYNG